jgi:glycosyltransferase involved in cell wall biosynthesis
VHGPIDARSEAFGQTYVEALAAGVPSVFTLSGVAPEFIRNEHNALVVPFRDAESIYRAIKRLLEDRELREGLVANGRKSASLFLLEKMIGRLKELYGS